jgi:hypothetical protein
MNLLLISETRIPRGLQRFFIFISFLFLFPGFVNAGEKNEVALYEKELFAPQVISNFGMGDERFRSLTAVQKRDLLEAKKTLISFLKATQVPDADLSRFLGRGLLAKYKSRHELLDKLLGQETEIHLAAITWFELGQDSALNLHYYVVLSSEGSLLLREDSAKLKKQGSYWEVMSVGGLE